LKNKELDISVQFLDGTNACQLLENLTNMVCGGILWNYKLDRGSEKISYILNTLSFKFLHTLNWVCSYDNLRRFNNRIAFFYS